MLIFQYVGNSNWNMELLILYFGNKVNIQDFLLDIKCYFDIKKENEGGV